MIEGSKTHLRANDEGYFEHLRFAATVGLLAIGAGLACLIHALVPALCTTTASRTIRQVNALLDDRCRLAEVRDHSSELLAFTLLLLLCAAVVAPLWLLPIADVLRLTYSALALALPLTLLVTNRELAVQENATPPR